MAGITQQMEDAYEEFLVEVPMLLEDLQGLLGKSKEYTDVKVDFEDDTLDRIERFYLDVIDGKEKVDVSESRLGRIFIAYLGEAVIERAGGEWYLNTLDGDPAFGTPTIAPKAGGVRFSPVERRELLKQNREPFLRSLVDYLANKEKFEEDFFKDLE
jgi:hypothetical protein